MAYSAWRSLVQRATEKPVEFVAGWRAPVAKGVSCPVHEHDVVELVYHRKGSGVTRLGAGHDRERLFPEGSCVLYSPHLPHDQVMDAEGEDICVHVAVPTAVRKKLAGCLVVPDATRWESENWDRLTRGARPSSTLDKALFNFRATTLLLAVLQGHFSQVDKAHPSGQQAVLQAEEYMREHFATIQSMEEVAQATSLSYDRLRHLFGEHRSTSMIAFLNHIKIERAKSLLVHSTLPLKQVATLCGFRDEYYFSGVFRRVVGQAPGSFRREVMDKPTML